jgi:hypothetical protein
MMQKYVLIIGAILHALDVCGTGADAAGRNGSRESMQTRL